MFLCVARAHSLVSDDARPNAVATPFHVTSFGIADEKCNATTNGQVFCDTECHYLFQCLNNRPLLLDDCESQGLFCYKPENACTHVNLCTAPEPVVCTGPGLFPDPRDCTYYHACDELNTDSEMIKCDEGKGFNIVTLDCSLPLDQRPCLQTPVPFCTSLDQSGPLIENGTFFYICFKNGDVFYPRVFICYNGGIFNAETSRCEIQPPKPIRCTGPGHFPDPIKCNVYHTCAEENVPSVPSECPPDSAYNLSEEVCNLPMDHRVCVEGPVPLCEVQGQSGALIEDVAYYYVCVANDVDLVAEIYKCDEGWFFSEVAMVCEEIPQLVPIHCGQIGQFPDPVDCATYHVCDSDDASSTPYRCAEETAYNLTSRACDLTTDHRVCTETPVPTCVNVGQLGHLQEDAAYYYVCVRIDGVLTPELHKCDDGWTFNDVTATCEEVPVVVLNPIRCMEPGQFPDPDDCTMYHDCRSGDGTPSEPHKCPDFTAYNLRYKTCDFPLDHRVCVEKPVPVCDHLGQFGALFEDPTYYYVCIRSGGNYTYELHLCPDDGIFNDQNGNCVTTPPPVDWPSIRCTVQGQFPDPVECTIYHKCAAEGEWSVKRLCHDDLAYNILYGVCDLPLTHRVCVETPVPVCEKLGQSGPLVEDPRYYYICLRVNGETVPELYLCGEGEVFNGVTGFCENPSLSYDSDYFLRGFWSKFWIRN